MSAESDLQRKVILAVDDERHMLRLLEFNLKRFGAGATVLTANGAVPAVSIARETYIDLVILDYSMPGMNGIETFHVIRSVSKNENLPAIMLTARGQSSLRTEAGKAGVNVFLTKPFSPVSLGRHVRELLRFADSSLEELLPQSS